jgi:diadenosine tetraphosphate (Ap4A) HIT family hydrolase
LIISPRVPVSSLTELSPDAQAGLGATLVAATGAIEAVVHPQRVYCALFAEENHSVHFHLFPRSDWLLPWYSNVHPADPEISGPRLMDWARRTFQKPITGMDRDETFEKIRSRLTLSTIAG